MSRNNVAGIRAALNEAAQSYVQARLERDEAAAALAIKRSRLESALREFYEVLTEGERGVGEKRARRSKISAVA